MEFECIYSVGGDLATYICNVVKVSIIEKETSAATFKGKHKPGKSNIDVEYLVINSTQIEYLPRGLSEIFPRLTNMQVNYCGLKEISRKDFEGFGQLEYLSMSNNELKSLPNDLFVDTPKLESIFFNFNKIERLSSKILDPLDKTNLKAFWLKGNSSIDMPFVQGGATTLEAFMKEIDAKFFKPNEMIENFMSLKRRLDEVLNNAAKGFKM